MADATEENGSTANNTERAPLSLARVKRNMENGKMAKESDGSVEVSKTDYNNTSKKNIIF